MSIRIGVIGLSKKGGWAAGSLFPPLIRDPLSSLYQVTALSNSTAESAETSAEHFSALTKSPIKGYHGSTTAIANDPNVDLVAVSIQVAHHKGAILPAIDAGKDLYIEWPLARTLQEAQEITQAAKAKGLRTLVGTQGWQIPAVRKVCFNVCD